MTEKIIIICGQTATGKSALAVRLAKLFKGEVINADSMQVYEGMDVGTAKITPEEMEGIPHHLFGVCKPSEDYNANSFATQASEIIKEIAGRGNLPIVTGGTGLYIKSLTHGLFTIDSDTKASRERLVKEMESKGLPSFYERLKLVDPDASARISPNDKQRILRALEVFDSKGVSISSLQREHSFSRKKFSYLKIGLLVERKILLERIRERTINMFSRGLIAEVETLLNKGYKSTLKPLNSIGYREALGFIEGRFTRDEAIEICCKRTRDYAKRQLTWFKKDREIGWFDPLTGFEGIKDAVRNFLKD